MNEFHNWMTCKLGYDNAGALDKIHQIEESSPLLMCTKVYEALIQEDMVTLTDIAKYTHDSTPENMFAIGLALQFLRDDTCIDFFEEACKADLAPAFAHLGHITKQDHLLELAISQSNCFAQFSYAEILYDRLRNGQVPWQIIKETNKKSWYIACLAMESGYPRSAALVARKTLEDLPSFTPEDIKSGWISWLSKACDLGDEQSMLMYGGLVFASQGLLENLRVTYDQALTMLKKVAAIGNLDAQEALFYTSLTRQDMDFEPSYLDNFLLDICNCNGIVYNWIHFIRPFEFVEPKKVNQIPRSLEQLFDLSEYSSTNWFSMTFKVNAPIQLFGHKTSLGLQNPIFHTTPEIQPGKLLNVSVPNSKFVFVTPVKQEPVFCASLYVLKEGFGRDSREPMFSTKVLDVHFGFAFVGKSKGEMLNEFYALSLRCEWKEIEAIAKRYLHNYPNDAFYTHVVKEMNWRSLGCTNSSILEEDSSVKVNCDEDRYQIALCKYLSGKKSEKTPSSPPEIMLTEKHSLSFDKLEEFAARGYLQAITSVSFHCLQRTDPKCIEFASKSNSGISHFIIGLYHHYVKKEHEISRDHFARSAGLGYPLSQVMIGLMYFHGIGGDISDEDAKFWLNKPRLSAHSGIRTIAESLYKDCERIFNYDQTMVGVESKRSDRKEFTKMWARHRNGDDHEADFSIAMSFISGIGVKMDHSRGYEMLKQLATKGDYSNPKLFQALMFHSNSNSEKRRWLDVCIQKKIDIEVQYLECLKELMTKEEYSKYIEKYSTVDQFTDLPEQIQWDPNDVRIILAINPDLAKSMTRAHLMSHKDMLTDLNIQIPTTSDAIISNFGFGESNSTPFQPEFQFEPNLFNFLTEKPRAPPVKFNPLQFNVGDSSIIFGNSPFGLYKNNK